MDFGTCKWCSHLFNSIVLDENSSSEAFNAHTHIIPTGAIVCGSYPNANPVTAPKILSPASSFDRTDYEDTTIKH